MLIACLRCFLPPLLLLPLTLGSYRAAAATALELRLPALISDHMVIQSRKDAALWGWGAPGTAIKAEFLDVQGKVLATADGATPPDGRWSLKLPALPRATSGTLRFTAGAAVKTVQDVLVGEVWLASGQSNMSYVLGERNVPAEMLETSKREALAAQGAIRYFNVDYRSGDGSNIAAEDVHGQWSIITADNYKGVSAVAWNFAAALREKIPTPVGLINSSVGGTSVTLWIPKSALDASPPGPQIEQAALDNIKKTNDRIEKYQAADAAWLQANPTPELQAKNAKTRPQKVWPVTKFCALYNGMIHGLEPYSLQGVIWFQADGDMGIPYAYGDLIKSLIKSWRVGFQQADLSFYYVEMNNMREYPPTEPAQGNDALSILRQQQQAALELPNTDVVCSIDLGLLEPEPHFPNKKPVGQRLALLAFNNIYGIPCAAHSPAYENFTVEGNKLRLHFKYAEGLRVRGGGTVRGFEIRGATGKWLWADGQVDGQDLLVWNDQISHPTEVHYAWSMNPIISMENGAGLPMRPFSTTVIKP